MHPIKLSLHVSANKVGMRALAQTERLWEAYGELQIDIDSKKARRLKY